MPCSAAKSRALSADRAATDAATAFSARSLFALIGRTTAFGAIRAAPRMPMRSGAASDMGSAGGRGATSVGVVARGASARALIGRFRSWELR